MSTIPSNASVPSSSEDRISDLLMRFDADRQQLIRSVRKAMQDRFPTANELVYDYARSFVIGYSPTEAGGEGIAALSADAGGVRFYLTQGASLPDPHKLLQGKAGARYIQVGSAAVLLKPEVEALMKAAEKAAKVPLPATGRGRVIIKPGGSEKKPRKKPAKP